MSVERPQRHTMSQVPGEMPSIGDEPDERFVVQGPQGQEILDPGGDHVLSRRPHDTTAPVRPTARSPISIIKTRAEAGNRTADRRIASATTRPSLSRKN